jgi:hypothetical protein
MVGAVQTELGVLLQVAFHEALTTTGKRCYRRKVNGDSFLKEMASPILREPSQFRRISDLRS